MWEKDKIYKLKSEEGILSPDGVAWVTNFIKFRFTEDVAKSISRIDPERWVVTRGKYSGSLTKRIWRFLNSEWGIKLDAQDMEEIGNNASQFVGRSSTQLWDFTQDFGWDAGDFGDSGSCFWGGRSEARDFILPSMGAWAMRVWEEECGEKVGVGRCWLVPSEGRWFLFNYYGPNKYGLFSAARLVSQLLGFVYRRVGIEPRNRDHGYDDTLYINSNNGAVVEKEESSLSEFKLYFTINHERCNRCEESFSEDDLSTLASGHRYCSDCCSDLKVVDIGGELYTNDEYSFIGESDEPFLIRYLNSREDLFRCHLSRRYFPKEEAIEIDDLQVSQYGINNNGNNICTCILDGQLHLAWNCYCNEDGTAISTKNWREAKRRLGGLTPNESIVLPDNEILKAILSKHCPYAYY